MKFCKHWMLLVSVITALSTTVGVTAQGPARGQALRAGGESPNDPTYLLGSESVQKELGLSDTQKASVQKLRDSDNATFSAGFRGQSQEAIRGGIEEPDRREKQIGEHDQWRGEELQQSIGVDDGPGLWRLLSHDNVKRCADGHGDGERNCMNGRFAQLIMGQQWSKCFGHKGFGYCAQA